MYFLIIKYKHTFLSLAREDRGLFFALKLARHRTTQ